MRLRILAAIAAFAAMSGCGYVGEPLPPALNIATRIADLRVVEYGDKLLIDFTIPQLTTEGIELRRIASVDLRIGKGEAQFDLGRWAAAAKPIPIPVSKPGSAHAEVRAADWTGSEVVIAVRIVNAKGRPSEWSNLVPFTVVAPLPVPTEFKASDDPQGVKLRWSSAASKFRVFRKAEGEEQPSLLAAADQPSYVDTTTVVGKRYEYIVQALNGNAESEVTAPQALITKDIFPPAAPSNLTAVPGIGAISLAWDRNLEPDLRGYRVYRAAEGADFTVLAEFTDVPAFSDRQIDAGKKYRYVVTAIDRADNESARSTVLEVTAP